MLVLIYFSCKWGYRLLAFSSFSDRLAATTIYVVLQQLKKWKKKSFKRNSKKRKLWYSRPNIFFYLLCNHKAFISITGKCSSTISVCCQHLWDFFFFFTDQAAYNWTYPTLFIPIAKKKKKKSGNSTMILQLYWWVPDASW